ncbi:epididymal secretory glutathione peroxidase-like [Varroa jacobsoni]|uniref:Glutathione peroxidase n=1 Tax=Varroa destructor TaxID=109461 RepID=A0A7M7KPC9_VARDE|nr:epididymal secretory glutathione peroxidase-like [Varroa destructor]XP_022692331.1 epididymal secretory glutathione peroxidase-like [Varroa jacobsoni]
MFIYLLCLVCLASGQVRARYDWRLSKQCIPTNGALQDFKIRNVTEESDLDLHVLTAGKLTLVVNVATYCEYTTQYLELNELQSKYGPSGFQIIGFPCNQFNKEEPGYKGEILNGVMHVRPGRGYVPNFPIARKIDVNGKDQHAIYTFLKAACPVSPQSLFAKREQLNYDHVHVNDIRWNFEKFLVSPSGAPLRRYHSSIKPSQLEGDIEQFLLFSNFK